VEERGTERYVPLAGVTLSVMSFELNGLDNLPALWPDDETFHSDADGRFEVTGFKPGVKCFIGVEAKARPSFRLDAGNVFRNVILTKVGEVRDLGDVKVKAMPSNQ
jgi:hypothetical protein